MFRRYIFIAAIVTCYIQTFYGQDYSRTEVENQLNQLKGAEKINFINLNYYKLYSSDFKNAEVQLKWAADQALQLGLKQEYAYALLYGGVVQYLSGNYPVVLEKYLSALRVFEKLEDHTGMAATHNEMAVFFHKQNDLNRCFESLDIAEQLSRKNGDLERLGTTLGNRGAILSVRGRLNEARPYFEEVYQIRSEQKDSVGLGYVLLDLAELALSAGNTAQCYQYIDQSTEIRKKINDLYGVVVNLVFKGEMKLREGKEGEAISFLENGFYEAKKIGYPDLVRQAADLLSKTYRKLGKMDLAFHYHEQADILKDSLLGADKTRIIQELQAKYETEKKEFKIREQGYQLIQNRWLIGFLSVSILFLLAVFVIWRQRMIAKRKIIIEEQKIQHQKEMTTALIASQEQERSRFASDLHDGMGQLMSSLRMVLQRSGLSVPPAAMELINQMHTDIRNIAFDLSPQTLREDGLFDALNELAARLNQSSVIRINIHKIDFDERLPAELEVSLYRICQEWLNNLFRHGKPNRIEIQVVRHPDHISLIVEDDSPGFDPSILDQSAGHGWRNIQSRILPFSGKVHVDSVPGVDGVIFLVEIPFVH